MFKLSLKHGEAEQFSKASGYLLQRTLPPRQALKNHI